MKIKGRTPEKPTRKIELACGEEIEVTAPRLGIHQKAFEVVPVTTVPRQKVVTKGQPASLLYDEKDPAYQAAEAKADFLRLVYLVWEGLRDNTCIQFDAQPGPDGPDLAFIEKIAEEMAAAGLTLADLTTIGDFVGREAGVGKDEAASAEGFSGSEASRRPPSSSGGQPEPGASAPASSSSSPAGSK